MSLPAVFLLAAAAASAPQPATRAEVAAQRAAIEQRFNQEKVECQERFSVSACLDDVRLRRHDALAPLVRREHELAAEERKARAVEQTQRVKERDIAAAQDEGQRREKVVAASPAPAPSTPASHAPRARTPEQARQLELKAEKKAEADAAKHRSQAEERQERQQKRIAEHEAKEKRRMKPAAAPLPLPGAASAASAASK